MRYTPQESLTGARDIPQLAALLQAEFTRIADALGAVDENSINFPVLHVLPGNIQPGMVAYFAADVVSTGSLEGLYRVDMGLNWEFIG